MKANLFLFLILSFVSHVFAAAKPGDFVVSGPHSKKQIALTFDDGPGPQTKEFLDLLDRYQVKATFFMLGEQVGNRPAVAKEVAARGHEVASHTTSHINYLRKLKEMDGDVARTQNALVTDMKKTNDILLKTTGLSPRICRMPHGIDRPWIKEAAKEAGLILVNWTYGADWTKGTFEDLAKGYVGAIKPGAIILFHDGNSHREKSLALTEDVLKSAREKGFEIVTVGQMLNLQQEKP